MDLYSYFIGNTVYSKHPYFSHLEFGNNHVVIRGFVIHVLHANEAVLVQKGRSRVDIVDSGVKAASADGIRSARQLPGVFEPNGFYLWKTKILIFSDTG